MKLIYRLVWENLKHRPVRTLLSAVFIGVQVTLILTLVGLSFGTLEEMQKRAKGTGADIMVRPPNSTAFSFTENVSQKYIDLIRKAPHVALAYGTLLEKVGDLDTFTGINLPEFNAMSGGFKYVAGGPFQDPHDVLIDQDYARTKNLHVGSTLDLGRPWHVCGIVESGMLSRIFGQLSVMQEDYSATGQVTIIYVKADMPDDIDAVKAELDQLLGPEMFHVYTMEEFLSLLTADNYPLIKGFTNVVIYISVIVGFLVVLLTMYTAVLERTREIGILKALGASPGYVLGILVREALMLAVIGTIFGIILTYGTRVLMHEFAPASLTQVIVPEWWPRAALIAIIGALLGSIYPGLKAARQDAIEALSYD